MGIVSELSIIVAAALACSIIAISIGLPPLLGHIAAGILIGHHVGLVQLGTTHDLEFLSELGIALLLFGLGLEFSLSQLHAVRRIAIFGTTIQMLLTIAGGFLVGKLIGLSSSEAAAFGCLISVSSTVVVLKNLSNLGLLSTLSARVMIGILIAQDIAVIPLMLLIPQLTSALNLEALALSMLKALLIIAAAMWLGKRVLPWFIERIARKNSRELFVISITTIALGVSYLGYLLGFSYAFGAFIAGIALSGSDQQHRALAVITPLRDLFVLVFFVSVGMTLNPFYLLENVTTVVLVLVALMASKALIFYILSVAFAYKNVVPIAVGLGLCQIGEFSFALAQLGMQYGTISIDTYNLTVSCAVLSILLSPFLARSVRPIYGFIQKYRPQKEVWLDANIPEEAGSDYVLIVGGGRVGSAAAKILRDEGKHPVVIEDNHQTALNLKNAGFEVLFGDGSNLTLLEAAEVHKASLLIIAMADRASAQVIVQYAKRHAPEIAIIARAHSRAEMKWLKSLGVNLVLEPFFEAGLEMAMQALKILKVDQARVTELSEKLRHEATV